MKINLSLDTNSELRLEDESRALRLLTCDNAFGKLYEIDNICRSALKHGDPLNFEKVLENIREEISDSRLLEYYT